MRSTTLVATRLPVCNVCGNDVEEVLVRKGGYEIYQCARCGLAFTFPQPETLSEQYDDSYFTIYRRRREFRLKRSDARLSRIEAIKRPGRLLDVGCSLGYFVEAACKRGWDASGVEISPYAAQEARDMGLDVYTGLLEDAEYPGESFDCVTMWDVLEHVSSPVDHMMEVRRILAPRGLVVVGTPDVAHMMFRWRRESWRHLKPSEHIFYFCRESIRTLLEKTGFDMVSCPSRLPLIGGAVDALMRTTQVNDVMTVYGVKNDL